MAWHAIPYYGLNISDTGRGHMKPQACCQQNPHELYLTHKHAHSKWPSQKRFPSARDWTSQNEITDVVSNPAYLKTESNNITAITTHTHKKAKQERPIA